MGSCRPRTVRDLLRGHHCQHSRSSKNNRNDTNGNNAKQVLDLSRAGTLLGWIWWHMIIRKGQGPCTGQGQGPRIHDKTSNRVSEEGTSAAPSARLLSWSRKVAGQGHGPGPRIYDDKSKDPRICRARTKNFRTKNFRTINPGACLSQSRGPAQGG